MEYVRKVDFGLIESAVDRTTLTILEQSPSDCGVLCIKTPPGSGSRRGLHTHDYGQMFYLLSGNMNLEIDGQEYKATPGSLILFPAGVPHRNWNDGDEATIHLSIVTPYDATGQSGEPTRSVLRQ